MYVPKNFVRYFLIEKGNHESIHCTGTLPGSGQFIHTWRMKVKNEIQSSHLKKKKIRKGGIACRYVTSEKNRSAAYLRVRNNKYSQSIYFGYSLCPSSPFSDSHSALCLCISFSLNSPRRCSLLLSSLSLSPLSLSLSLSLSFLFLNFYSTSNAPEALRQALFSLVLILRKAEASLISSAFGTILATENRQKRQRKRERMSK